jgi:thiol-disulfide isomerase/thioredoxin
MRLAIRWQTKQSNAYKRCLICYAHALGLCLSMMSLSIGPLAMPMGPVKILLAFLLASWLAGYVTGRTTHSGSRGLVRDTLLNAVLVGLLAGRLVFVAQYAHAYESNPWAALDIRDGGWNAWASTVAGIAWVAWRQAAVPALRRPLWAGTALGLTVWLGISAWINLYQVTSLPDLTVMEVKSGRSALLPQVSAGRPRVINLWASWCGPCRQEMPMLVAAQEREKSVDILFVNQGESADVVRSYIGRNHPNLNHVWLDPNAELGPAMGSRGLPTTLFIDAAGHVVDAHMGVLNGPALSSKLQQLQF